ncbi:MAG: Uma2 family endonuclease [Gemmataceae bacterium]
MSVMSPPQTRSIPEPPLFEVVNGQVVESAPMGAFETSIATILTGRLLAYVEQHQTGRVLAETLFSLQRDEKLKRRPDVAYVSYDRWPKSRRVPSIEGWDVVPDLAVEIVSPSNTANEILVKNGEYFDAGVRLIWVVYPEQERIFAFSSATEVKILTTNDTLEGGEVLPGLALSIASLFADAA